jgi:hypothetical protein
LKISRVGQNHIYIQCVYGIFGREFTIYTVIYGVYIRFWPTLKIRLVAKTHASSSAPHMRTSSADEEPRGGCHALV